MDPFAHAANYADWQTCAWDSEVEQRSSDRAAPSSKMDSPFRVRRRRSEKEPPSVEPARPQPKSRRKSMRRESHTLCAILPRVSRSFVRHNSMISFLLLVLASVLIPGARAVFIAGIENCLDPSTKRSDPKLLQFTPLWLSAVFDSSSPNHNLNVTIYGNVSGQSVFGPYPPPDSPDWTNPNITFGKILNYSVTDTGEVFTTLDSTVKVLTYTPFFTKTPFWGSVINGSVPLGPSFDVSPYDPYGLSTFSVQHDFDSSYAFATFAATFRIVSGDVGARTLGCVSASITPDLGSSLSNAIRYLPAAVLALMGMATVAAAILSPWGTSDPFRWTSNYGRDEDLLRLVTPGFGDCLQYIQFVVLTGGLNLAYPGYYQPVVSRAGWSSLLFNESFASHGPGFQPVVDGVYHTNGTYGLTRMRQLVGMNSDEDIWPCLAVFLLGITLCVILLCQLGFLSRWGYRALSKTTEEDLRSKNWPFTAGNIVRIVFNYFLLPIVTLSMFQMVQARHTTPAVVAMAVVLLVAVIGFATWIFSIIFTTRPRAYLFDDLPTVLMLGPLYNTYSDDAAPFAFIPVLLTFLRGVAIGAIQPSGIAQLVILVICEIVLILTLNAFRPFQANTSMNAYHTFFSVIRLVTTLLSVAFVPSLGVTEGPRGWFGYIILLLHAIVLVFGFFLNALQTLIEVFARLAGAGDARGGLTKVLGWRQLKRRGHQRNQRSSLNSDAAMLSPEQDQKSLQLVDGGRSRSMSASSAVLLNNHRDRMSAGFDRQSQGGEFSIGGMSSGPGTPGGAASPFTYLPSGSGAGPSAMRSPSGLKPGEVMMDPYYRPPRLRRPTLEGFTPGDKSRASWIGDPAAPRSYKDSPEQGEGSEFGEGATVASNRGSMTPAYLRSQHNDSDLNLPAGRGNTDYAVREADFYYGVSRGPALSNLPTRRLRTGPADPMGPVASASTWLKGFFVGKRKDKGKGFEVIRSTRAPPQMMPLEEVDTPSPPLDDEPYHDSPEGASAQAGSRRPSRREIDGGYDDDDSDPYELRVHRVSEAPPALDPIESVGGIDLPSRMGSRSTVRPAREASTKSQAPTIPRKSSRRAESREISPGFDFTRLSTVPASPTMDSHRNSLASSSHLQPYQPGTVPPMQLPFASGEPSPSPERTSQASSLYPPGEEPAHPDRGGPFLGPEAAAERPVSTGYVQHHVAGERIQPGLYDANAHMGTQAELVDLAMTRSRSTGRSTEHSNH